MGWKEVYAKSFDLQPHLEVTKKEIMEYGNESGTVCKVCENTIPAKEKYVEILIRPKDISPEIHSLGGYYYRVCMNCDNRAEKLD